MTSINGNSAVRCTALLGICFFRRCGFYHESGISNYSYIDLLFRAASAKDWIASKAKAISLSLLK
jgi:hypothetical protein